MIMWAEHGRKTEERQESTVKLSGSRGMRDKACGKIMALAAPFQKEKGYQMAWLSLYDGI